MQLLVTGPLAGALYRKFSRVFWTASPWPSRGNVKHKCLKKKEVQISVQTCERRCGQRRKKTFLSVRYLSPLP
jgi:hypothetical protein